MLDLLNTVRLWRRDARDIEVTLFDRPAGDEAGSRDRGMANFLGDIARASTGRLLVVLTGNFHSRVVRGTRQNPNQEPMGWALRDQLKEDRVVALDVAHTGGTAWVCLGSGGCGTHAMRPRGPAGSDITWNDSAEQTSHHGWYHVGALRASRPARTSDTP